MRRVLVWLILMSVPASASETIDYSYDARGRLIKVSRSGTVNNGLSACYSYDKADNRANVTVAGWDCSGLPPSFSINDMSVTEGGSLVLTVTKSVVTANSLSIDFATANGNAAAGSDYTANSGTLTFAPGETTKSITVVTSDDTSYEGTETLFVNLSGATGSATISDGQGQGTINDNDNAPSFAINDTSVTEGGNLIFTVTKSGTTSHSLSVNFATANGSASAGSDYTANSGTLTFAPGETSKTITVGTSDDASYEGTETLFVNLSGATNGATISDGQGQGTINDNENAPSFAINDASATEGGSLILTVTKSGATSNSSSVAFATANGSAAAGSDYSANSGTLTFSPGETTKTITIGTSDDTSYEETETLFVNLSGATGATIGDGQGQGTINDNDSAPSFRIYDWSVAEGENLVIAVAKLGTTSISHNINFATADGTATAGSDYTANSGTLTFSSGESTKNITISTVNDTTYEASEYLYINLSGATGGATISDGQAVGGINNNDEEPPAFFIGNADPVSEGGNIAIQVSKSRATTNSYGLNYATANGSAAAGSDYSATSGTLTFAPGETSKWITVATINDAAFESTEDLYVNLSGATGGSIIADNQGVATILDNDVAPSFAVNDVRGFEGGLVAFTVTKSGSSTGNLTVNYATASGTAVAGTHFSGVSGILTFGPSEYSKTVSIATIDDPYYEPWSISFYLNLSGASGGATITDSQGIGWIDDDDLGGGEPGCPPDCSAPPARGE